MIAHTIGSVASQLLRQPQQAVLVGVTSRGLFLRLACDWVVFITSEAVPGPLTIQVGERISSPEPTGLRSLARVEAGGIFFDDGSLIIKTDRANIWQSPARPLRSASMEERRSIWADVRQRVAADAPRGFSFLLPYVAGSLPSETGELNPAVPALQNLKAALDERQSPLLASAAEAFLGLGAGLTPSGDDLVMGLLLTLNRWGDILLPGLDIVAFNRDILEGAYRKTTTLSANLIECASKGLADARLVLALDGLVTGQPGIEAVLQALGSWGSSSGIDALVGMALVIGL